jgi:hypothetical protein
MSPAAALVLLVLLIGSTPAAAQTARLEGTVIDSVRGIPLVGARVQVGEGSRRFVTDSAGRFRADSLPGGPQPVRFTHMVLDSLGIRSAPVTVRLRPDTTVRVELGIPSGPTFLARLCRTPRAAARRADGGSAIFGVVRAAESDAPVTAAKVQLQWLSVIVDRALGIRRQVNVSNAVTDSAGLYVVCDAPAGVDATLTIAATGYDTAAAELHLDADAVVLQHVSLVARRDSAAAIDEPAATLTGTIRDEEGKPLESAEVMIVTRAGAVAQGPARTDAGGRFTLRGARAGTQVAEVRRLGSAPVRRTVTLASAREARLDVTLRAQAVVLQEVAVTGESAADRNGFTMRRAMGRGQFYTRDDIGRRNVADAGDLVRQLPGMRVDRGAIINQSPRQNVSGSSCAISTLLNGVLTPADFVLNIPREEIDAIEVYDVAARVPVEFAGPETACGAILIRTRQAR